MPAEGLGMPAHPLITAEQFQAATGHQPKDDDLERCNCPKAGQIGHQHCGWDADRGLPRFIPTSKP